MRTWIHPKPIHGSDWFTAFIDDSASGKLTGFILVERVNHLHFHLNCCETASPSCRGLLGLDFS